MLLYFGTGEGKFFVMSFSGKMSLFLKKEKYRKWLWCPCKQTRWISLPHILVLMRSKMLALNFLAKILHEKRFQSNFQMYSTFNLINI